jgi:hypothetical protein
VPYQVHKRIIDVIKEGSCFFVNSPDQWYVNNSTILNWKFDLAPSVQLQSTASANLESTSSTNGAVK